MSFSDQKEALDTKYTLAPLPETARGYGRMVYAAKTRKDGDWMIYTYNRHVILRRLDDPRISMVFSDHKAKVGCAAISPNGNWVASGDENGVVLVWGRTNGIVKTEIQAGPAITDICWDSDSKKFAAVGRGNDSLGKVFNYDSSNKVGDITGHSKCILSVAMKPNRPFRVATAGEDLSVNFFNAYPVKFDHSVKNHSRYPNRVMYSPSGDQFITVGSDQKIIVYDGKTGEVQKEIESKDEGHKGAIYSFSWSPDSTKILTCSSDKTAKIWNVAEGRVETTFTVSQKPTVDDMQMGTLWFGDYIITISLSGAINYWDPANPGAPKQVVHGHKASIQAIAIDRASGLMYTCDNIGKVSVWKDGVATWFTGKGHGKPITAAGISCDGSTLVTAGLDDTVRLNETKTNEFNTDAIALGGKPNAVACGKKDAALIAVGLAQEKLVIIRSGRIVASVDIKYKPLAVEFSPDDTELMVGGADMKVYFYSVSDDNLKQERTMESHGKKVTSVRYSPDGATMTSTGLDQQIFCCDAKGEVKNNRTQWGFHSSMVNDHDWNPSGTRVASVANDLAVMVFTDTAKFSSDRLTVQNAQMDGITNVAWFDDDTFASSANDGTLKVWEVPK